MSGLPLMKDAFATGGSPATAGAAGERAAVGHRRPSADTEAFAEIVSSLGRETKARQDAGTAGAPAETTATADRHRPMGSPSSPFDLAAGASEPDPGTVAASDAMSKLHSPSSLEAAPEQRTQSALRAAAALFHGAAADKGIGFGTAHVDTTAPGLGSLAPSSPFDGEAGAAETDPGTVAATDLTSTLDPTSSLEATPERRTQSALHAAAAILPGAASDRGIGLGTAHAEATAPFGGSLAPSEALLSDPGLAPRPAAAGRDDRDTKLTLPIGLPSPATSDERVPAPTEEVSERDATLATPAAAPSDEETSAGVEATRVDGLEARGEPATLRDGTAVPPATVANVLDGLRTADVAPPASQLPDATGASRALLAVLDTRPSGADAPTAANAGGASVPDATRADPDAPFSPAGRSTEPKALEAAGLPRPAAPLPAQGDGPAAPPLETGPTPPALPAAAATPVRAVSAADATAQAAGANGARVSAQVREMRTYFAPVIARTIAAAASGKPEGVAAASAAPAAMEAAATAVDATPPGTFTAPLAPPGAVTAPLAPSNRTTGPSTAPAPLATTTSPAVIEAPGPTAVGGPQPIMTRAVAEGAGGSGTREAAPPAAPTSDQRVSWRPESAAARRGDGPEATAAAPIAAEIAAVSASADAAAPTTSAGPPTDLPLRALAQEIGRIARPLAADGGSPLATTTASPPTALRRDVEVELSAPEFGVVRVRMRLSGSSLELRLRTDDPGTLTLLAERRTELERAISEAGVDAKVVDVSRTVASTPAASPTSPGGQSPASDGGRAGEGQPFEQRPSPDRNDRRSPFDRQTDGSTPDEDPTYRAGTRPGTLFV